MLIGQSANTKLYFSATHFEIFLRVKITFCDQTKVATEALPNVESAHSLIHFNIKVYQEEMITWV